MILNKKLYDKNKIKFWWFSKVLSRSFSNQISRMFQLQQVSWPLKPYLYSDRFRSVPLFSGNVDLLKTFSQAKKLESLCPTNALKVHSDHIQIDSSKCVLCQLCVEASPEGIFLKKNQT